VSSPEEAIRTMIKNMPEKTGKSLEQWFKLISSKKLGTHGEIMKFLKGDHDVTHGFANTITILFRQQLTGGPSSDDELVDAQYAGDKAALRPLYEAIVKSAKSLGNEVSIAPKKANVSLRRSKQFGLIQPSTKDRIDLGLNLPNVRPSGRLEAWTGMCTHRIRLDSPEDFNKEAKTWLKKAYDQA
jgi:hypothetical protein